MAGFTSNRHLPGFAKSVRRVPALLVAAALLWTAASTFTVYPHQLAYFNELAGGPENGHRHLLGSNLDWGQDLLIGCEVYTQHDLDGYVLKATYSPMNLLRFQEHAYDDRSSVIVVSREGFVRPTELYKTDHWWHSGSTTNRLRRSEYTDVHMISPTLSVVGHGG